MSEVTCPSSLPTPTLRPCFSANTAVMRAEALSRKPGCAGRTRADARPDSGSARYASGPPGRRGLRAVLAGVRRPSTTAPARPPADQTYSDRRRKTVPGSLVRDGRQPIFKKATEHCTLDCVLHLPGDSGGAKLEQVLRVTSLPLYGCPRSEPRLNRSTQHRR
jgi:hypothetical protein